MPLLHFINHPGPADATPLLIAHGLFGSARNWNVIARKLASDRPVIAVDMRNHGESFHHLDNSYHALADDLASIIEHAGGKAHLLGHSMGGKAAMVLALHRPEMIAKLVIADIAPVNYSHNHSANFAAMRSVDLGRVTRRADADAQLALTTPDAGLRGFFLQSLAITPEGARWKLNLENLETNAARITGFPETQGSFQGPTLFVKGSLSDYIKTEDELKIRELFPQAHIETIADAGHWLQADQPVALVAALAIFLNP